MRHRLRGVILQARTPISTGTKVPNYSFRRTTNGPVVTKDLLAVVGGYTGVGRSQYLRVIDISNPLDPQWEAGVTLRSIRKRRFPAFNGPRLR